MIPVDISIFFLIFLAALLHAVWNALVKGSQEREVVLGFVAFGHFCLGLILAGLAPLPTPDVWGLIVISSFVHYLYYFGLNQAYKRGDLSIVYPIARGIVPPLVALGGLIFVNESLSPLTWIGIIICSIGLILFAFPTVKNRSPSPFLLERGGSIPTLLTALITGVTITTYSLLDGIGGRKGDTPLSFIAWLFIFELPVFLVVLFKNRQRLSTLPRRVYQQGVIGGWIAALTYGIIIYAKSVTELGIVSTLRETSIVFATLIGILIFKERPWRIRLLASLIVITGIVTLLVGYRPFPL